MSRLVTAFGLFAVGAVAHAQEDLRLALPPSTLPETLAECAKRFGIEYVAVGCTDRPEEPLVSAGCIEALMDEVLAAYGAAGIGFDGLWLIDARPAPQDRWEALARTFPGGAAVVEADADAIREELGALFRETFRPEPEPPTTGVLLVPFEAPTADLQAVNAYRLRQTLDSLQGALGAPLPEAEGWIRLDPNRGLHLLSGSSSYKVADIPKAWEQEWAAAVPGLERPHFELHLTPLVVQRGLSPSLQAVVDLTGTTSLKDVADRLTTYGEVSLAVSDEDAPLRIDAAVRPMSLWLALTALSAASGLQVDLSSQKPRYALHGDGGPEAGLYRASTPAQRLYQLQYGRAWHCRPFAMWLWLSFSDQQRAALEAGEALDASALAADRKWLWREVMRSQREALLLSTLGRVLPILRATTLRGMLVFDELGNRGALLRVQAGECVGWDLPSPAAHGGPPGPQGKRGAWLLGVRLGVLSADRRRRDAQWWTYGTRSAAPSHRGAGDEQWLPVEATTRPGE